VPLAARGREGPAAAGAAKLRSRPSSSMVRGVMRSVRCGAEARREGGALGVDGQFHFALGPASRRAHLG
jgi:hypothetical protein